MGCTLEASCIPVLLVYKRGTSALAQRVRFVPCAPGQWVLQCPKHQAHTLQESASFVCFVVLSTRQQVLCCQLRLRHTKVDHQTSYTLDGSCAVSIAHHWRSCRKKRRDVSGFTQRRSVRHVLCETDPSLTQHPSTCTWFVHNLTDFGGVRKPERCTRAEVRRLTARKTQHATYSV